MRVFVTGATGFIGSAIVGELRAAGHSVLGLARSDDAAERLRRAGVEALRGDLADPDGLAAAARACDGVIHTAFIHDFAAYAASIETDRTVVRAFVDALAGSGKPFVSTSVTTLLAPGRLGAETDAPSTSEALVPRAASEATVLTAAEAGVRASVVRLPPSVHGVGDHGFVPALIDIARRTGIAAHVGDGANRWPAVHRLDAARLYRMALEEAAPGTRLHAAAEEGIAMRSIAEAIATGLGVPTRSLAPEEVATHFGWIGHFAATDNPTSSTLTRAAGWHPVGPDLLTDMREGGYFD